MSRCQLIQKTDAKRALRFSVATAFSSEKNSYCFVAKKSTRSQNLALCWMYAMITGENILDQSALKLYCDTPLYDFFTTPHHLLAWGWCLGTHWFSQSVHLPSRGGYATCAVYASCGLPTSAESRSWGGEAEMQSSVKYKNYKSTRCHFLLTVLLHVWSVVHCFRGGEWRD